MASTWSGGWRRDHANFRYFVALYRRDILPREIRRREQDDIKTRAYRHGYLDAYTRTSGTLPEFCGGNSAAADAWRRGAVDGRRAAMCLDPDSL